MTRHSVNVAITAVLGVGAFLGFWWMIADLLLRTMPQLLHSSGETALDAFVILMMVTAILTGALVAIQAHQRDEAPRKHHFGLLRPRLHH
jgi:hypothetical protein